MVLKPSCSVVIPTLNERENLEKLLAQLRREVPLCEVVVADNGSTDGTVELAKEWGCKTSCGHGLVGDAVLRGLGEASGDSIVVMDGDLSHPVETVEELVDNLCTFDLVVARREDSKDTLFNRFLSFGYNLLTYPLSPKVGDRSSGFWAIRKHLRLPQGTRPTMKPMMEHIVRGRITNIAEVPYVFNAREVGRSKNGKPVVRVLLDVSLLYYFKFGRPIKFLVVGGTGVFLNLGLLYFLTENLRVYYIASSAVAIAVATIWNYLLNNYWTFGKKDLL